MERAGAEILCPFGAILSSLGVIFAHFRQFSRREPLSAPKAGLNRPSGDKENGVRRAPPPIGHPKR